MPAFAQPAPDWSGRWETFWRDGAAVVALQQDGNAVTGTYEPGGGLIEGQVEAGSCASAGWSTGSAAA
ncbi:hypothetical protein C1J03_25055 (plasmid) [Sulfitobacter sp. SK012]|nr:hypothetical protein C1J03_25055 [Sulfitobacter sp. SK012]